jgi:hypothetical protein
LDEARVGSQHGVGQLGGQQGEQQQQGDCIGQQPVQQMLPQQTGEKALYGMQQM